MSDRSKERRISDVAKDMAQRNRTVFDKVNETLPPTLREAAEGVLSPRDLDEDQLGLRILDKMATRNAPRIDEGAKNILTFAHSLSDEIDKAGAALEKSQHRWLEIAGATLEALRTKRLAISSELSDTMKAVRDATGLIEELDGKDALTVLAKFAEAGATLRKAYGDMGLVRLADALLVLSEASSERGGA